MTQGIYKLINNKNSKVYIGQSNNIEERYKSHMYMLENNTHHAYKLQRMYNKYKNLKHFKIEFDILEIVSNDKYLDARENYYIQFYNSHHNGYNSIGTNGDKTHTKN